MMRHNIRAPGESQKQSRPSLLRDAIWAGLGDPLAEERLAAERDAAVWVGLADAANHSEVAALAYPGCRQAAGRGAPISLPVLESLRRQAVMAAARNVRLERAAGAVVAAAAGAGLRLLWLKGLPLAKLVYADRLPRPMDDVDLLVAPQERACMEEILTGLGYRNDLRGEEDFFAPDRSYSIDLHVGLVNGTRLPARQCLASVPFDLLWRRSQPLIIAGVAARTLSPADTIAHLALHAVHHHGLSGAVWPVDMVLAFRRWPEVSADLTGMPSAIRRSLWYCLEALASGGADPDPETRLGLRPRRLFPAERWAAIVAGRGRMPEEIRYGFTLACLTGRARLRFVHQLITQLPSLHGHDFKDARTSQAGGRVRALWRAILGRPRNGG